MIFSPVCQGGVLKNDRLEPVDDQEFRLRADEALHELNTRLTLAANDYPLEADMSGGALVIEFEDSPAKFVVSPNSPVRQIWVSALSRSFKLDWVPTLSLIHI